MKNKLRRKIYEHKSCIPVDEIKDKKIVVYDLETTGCELLRLIEVGAPASTTTALATMIRNGSSYTVSTGV